MKTDWSSVDPSGRSDGFRPRRVRPEGWREAAFAAGEIADTPQPHRAYPQDAVVVEVPHAEGRLVVLTPGR